MYEKQNFVKGQKLKAEQLNHMEDGIAAALEQSGAGSYIFTGVYELREDGNYLVLLKNDFSWEMLVDAVHNSKHVGCILYDDNHEYPICFSLGGAWFNDGTVKFHAIRENGWVYELIVFDDGSALLQKYNTKNYIITGTYTLDDNVKIDSVTLDDSFDYDEMVAAIKAGRYVAVRLVDDIDRFYHEVFNLKYWSAEENYVVFTQTSTTSIIELEIWNVDGNYKVYLTEREISGGGGGTTIDLLWENPQCFDDDDAPIPFPSQEVPLPNADDYDFFDVVFCKNINETTSLRLYSGYHAQANAESWDIVLTGAGAIYREKRTAYIALDNNEEPIGVRISGGRIEELVFGEGHSQTQDDTVLIPYRIYGIKGVNKQSVASLFTLIIGGEAEMLTFMPGMTWGEWCASKYNTFGLSINSDGEVRYEADDSFVSFDGVVQKSDFLITAGAEYTLG